MSDETPPSKPEPKPKKSARTTPPPQSRQAAKPRGGQVSGAQVMFAAILAIGMVMGINFSTRIASSRPLREGYDDIQTEIAGLEAEQATLLAELEFAQSDAFVEQWARSEGKMVRPGEVLVVPRAVENTDPRPTQTPAVIFEVTTGTEEPSNFSRWWSLFFDSPPPDF